MKRVLQGGSSRAVRRVVRNTDRALMRRYVAVRGERDRVVSVLLHTLYTDRDEIEQGVTAPQQNVLVSQFREFVQHFHELGYRFVSPEDVVAGLTPGHRYLLITFDDGYANNRLAIPVLEEFDVPATFFVSTRFVREQRAFWCDVVFRERSRRGVAEHEIVAEIAALQSATTSEVDRHLVTEFGRDHHPPLGEADRPLTPGELEEFAAHRLVHVGNHTVSHTDLTRLDPAGVHAEVVRAQDELAEITGTPPLAIAYPYGRVNRGVVEICRSAGLGVGLRVTEAPRRNRLPIVGHTHEAMMIDRFVLSADRPIDHQCIEFRSGLRPLETMERLLGRR
jgi:peptidoglycan/xylan/chitin deacetylase (PgdA/CDA1 family)